MTTPLDTFFIFLLSAVPNVEVHGVSSCFISMLYAGTMLGTFFLKEQGEDMKNTVMNPVGRGYGVNKSFAGSLTEERQSDHLPETK